MSKMKKPKRSRLKIVDTSTTSPNALRSELRVEDLSLGIHPSTTLRMTLSEIEGSESQARRACRSVSPRPELGTKATLRASPDAFRSELKVEDLPSGSRRVDKFDDEDLFDDCPVCQAIKFAQEKGWMPTPQELKKAFKKAKEKGAVVGGEWFEKPREKSDEE